MIVTINKLEKKGNNNQNTKKKVNPSLKKTGEK